MTLLFKPQAVAMALLAFVPGAFAASTTDLVVKGLITPSACTPQLSGGGVIDHGKISAKDLSANNATVIGNDSLQMSVTCEAQTLIAVQAADNRADSSERTAAYGLGLVAGKPLGGFFLRWSRPLADDVMVQPIGSFDEGQSWSPESIAEPGMYMSIAPMGNSHAPYAIKRLDLELGIQTYITRTNDLDLSNEVPIDGSATLEVKYL